MTGYPRQLREQRRWATAVELTPIAAEVPPGEMMMKLVPFFLAVCSAFVVTRRISAQSAQLVTPTPSSIGQTDLVRAADFNGDGLLDLLVGTSTYFSTPSQIAVHRNLSALTPGLFDAGLAVTVASGGAIAVEPADLDGDGRMDLITGSGLIGSQCSQSFSLQAFLNSSPQPAFLAFTPQVALATSYPIIAMRYGDFLPSPGSEVAVLDRCGNQVRFYSVSAAPVAFSPVGSFAIATAGASMECADMDGDGDLDLVIGGDVNTTVAFNLGNGSFFTTVVPAPGVLGVAISDVDLDGRKDIALAHSGVTAAVTLCRQPLVGTFSVSSISLLGSCCTNAAQVAFGNVNGDAYPDLVVIRNGLGAGQKDIVAFVNQAASPFYSLPVQLSAAAGNGANAISGLVVSDFDGFPGDDFVRLLPFSVGSVIESWRNTTPQVGRPFPGTASDFVLTTTIVGPLHSELLGGQPVKPVLAGDTVTARIHSPGGVFNGLTAILGAQVFATGAPPSPTLPALGLHFDLGQPLFLLFNGFEQPYPLPFGQGGLPAQGVYSTFTVPAGLPASQSLLLQGFVLGSATFAATDGHELRT